MPRCSVVALMLLGCVQQEEVPSSPVTVEVTENPYNRFSAVVDVSDPDGRSIQIQHTMGTTEAQEPGEVLVLGLAADTTHTLTVLADGEAVETVDYATPPLPDDWPTCEVTGGYDATEVVCTNGVNEDGGMYFCVDRQGVPVWSLEHPDGELILAVRALPDGGYAAVGDSKSILAIFDERGEMVREYTPTWLSSRTRFEHGYIDMHEVIAITEGPWAGAVAFLTGTEDVVHGEVMVANGIVVLDPSTDEVLWDWSAHGELGDETPMSELLPYERVGLEEDREDWQHANALVHRVAEDGSEQFWVSLRHQDWVVAIDVDDDSVVWRLGFDGDFTGPDEAWFFQQHAPEVRTVDGALRVALFDNGKRRPFDEAYTRVIELELDTEAMTVSLVAEADVAFSPGHGDADVLQDGARMQYTLGWSDDEPRIVDLSWPEGEALWSVSCGSGELYRSTWFPTIYQRNWWYEVAR